MRTAEVASRWIAATVVTLTFVCLAAHSASAQEKAPSSEAAAQVIAAAQALAERPSGLVQLFAKRIIDVLARNKVPLGARLAGMQLQPNQVNVDDKELSRVHEIVARIIEPAPQGKGLGLALRVELLDAVACYCPSSASSMEAAAELARIAQNGLSGQGELAASPELAATAIREALYKCFDHTHCAWIDADDVRALKLAADQDLLGTLAYLLACAGKKDVARLEEAQTEPRPDAETLAKDMEQVKGRVSDGAAPREVDSAPGADDALKGLLARAEALCKETPAIAELAGARKDLSRTLQQFFAAVSQEDRPSAAACVSPTMAKALEKLSSLRSAIGGAAGVEKIEFQYIARFGAPDGKRFVDAQVIVSTKDAGPKPRTARLWLTRTSEGWKVTVP